MAEVGCLKDSNLQCLNVEGVSHLKRPLIETITGSGRTLTAADSGKLFLLDSDEACTITLPATASSYSAGELIFDFHVVTTNTAAYRFLRGTDGDLLYGALFCFSDTAEKCIGVGSLATNDTLWIDSNDAVRPGGEPGSTIRIISGGSVAKAWLLTGSLFTIADTVTTALYWNS